VEKIYCNRAATLFTRKVIFMKGESCSRIIIGRRMFSNKQIVRLDESWIYSIMFCILNVV